MGTKRFWTVFAVVLGFACVLSVGTAHAGDDIATPKKATSKDIGAPPAGDLRQVRAERRLAPLRGTYTAPRPVPARLVQPAGLTPSVAQPGVVPPARNLYDSELRPGMVLRTWRAPAAQPGVIAPRVPSAQPGIPGPDDADFSDFPPCQPRPTGPTPAAPQPALPPSNADVDMPPAGPAMAWPDDEAPPAPPPADEVIVEEEPAPLEVIEAPAEAPGTQRRIVRNVYQPATPYLGGDCDPACGQRRDKCCWPVDCCGRRYGRFELTVEGMFSIPNSPEGYVGETIFGANDQFDWESLDYELELGARGTARYAVAPGKWLEGRFTWFGDGWDDTANSTLGRFGFAPGPGGVGGASTAAQGILSSEAEMWSAEVNFVGEFECSGDWRWDLIVGFRTMRFEETSRLDFPGGVLVGAGPAFVQSDVENHLLAAQFGIGAHWDASPNFTLNFSLKGIMGDLSRKADVTDTSIFVGGPHAARSTATEIVFGADIEIGFRWRLSRCIALTGGYNMLFVDNVLRAYDAMDFSHSTSGAAQARQQLNQLIVHSVFAGVNINL